MSLGCHSKLNSSHVLGIVAQTGIFQLSIQWLQCLGPVGLFKIIVPPLICNFFNFLVFISLYHNLIILN